jgi:hypothetical protein
MSVTYLNSLFGGESRKPFINFNFKNSLIDTVHGFTATLVGWASRNNNGVSLTRGSAAINLSSTDNILKCFIFTYEVDIGDCNLDMSDGKHKRFFMWSSNSGLIYRSTGYWGIYNGAWYMTEISDKDYFKNSTVKLSFEGSNVKLYKNNELVYEFSNIGNYGTGGYSNTLFLGMDEQAAYNMVIEALRVYTV